MVVSKSIGRLHGKPSMEDAASGFYNGSVTDRHCTTLCFTSWPYFSIADQQSVELGLTGLAWFRLPMRGDPGIR